MTKVNKRSQLPKQLQQTHILCSMKTGGTRNRTEEMEHRDGDQKTGIGVIIEVGGGGMLGETTPEVTYVARHMIDHVGEEIVALEYLAAGMINCFHVHRDPTRTSQ